MSKPVILLGGGGHARVVLTLSRRLGIDIIGIADPRLTKGSHRLDLLVIGDDSAVFNYPAEQVRLLNGIGSIPRDAGLRSSLYERFSALGYQFQTLLDPMAFVAEDAILMEGAQVMAGAIIQTGTLIAENSIVNSGAIIEHDCQIGKHVHVAPGATLCGSVTVDDGTHIGANATIIQGIKIGANSVIGAGAVVTRDIGSRQIVYPARSAIRDL